MNTPTSDASSNPVNLQRGPISWMARHGIAPHLLMLILILGGIVMSTQIKKEYLPAFTLDQVDIRVYYPGATPVEMEQGIVLPIENEVASLDGISEVNVSVQQGYAYLGLEISAGENLQQKYQDVLQAVNRISTFPAEMETPSVSILSRQRDIMDIALHGDLSPFVMKQLAENIKEALLDSPGITQVAFKGVRDEEVHVEISKFALEKYDLTLNQVAQIISANAVEQGAGSVRTQAGEVLVTLNNRQYWAKEFSSLPLISDESGVLLTLGEVATVTEGFEDTNNLVTFNGQNSVRFSVYRAEDQTPISVAESIYEMWDELEALLPPGAHLTVTDDDAENYKDRLGLLLKNAFIGLLLVYILLSIFLEYRLAFWVTMGIPTSFLGAMLFLPAFDVSINMVSMFAFIISLGIVVDDAIIAGENIYQHMSEGHSRIEAAILGAKQVSVPLGFAILTNIVAFMPLFMIPGGMGQVMMAIPVVVVCCFAISWVEALYILPSHISHMKTRPDSKLGRQMDALQSKVDAALVRWIHRYYRPFLGRCLQHPVLTLSISLSIMLVVFAYPMSGRMGFSMFPQLEGESAFATAELPQNAPLSETMRVRDRMEAAFKEMIAPLENKHGQLFVHIKSEISGSTVEVSAQLVAGGKRPFTTNQIVQKWRQALGDVAGTKSITFDAERGGGPVRGRAFTIELRSSNTQALRSASAELTDIMDGISGVADVSNSFTSGKPQWDIEVNEQGRSLGLTDSDVARQVRAALYGARAVRQQRGKSEVTVLVRLPQDERLYDADIERVSIVTPSGGRVPLRDIANLSQSQAPSKIVRRDGRRVVTITSDVQPRSLLPALRDVLNQDHLPDLKAKYPSISFEYRGRQAREKEVVSSLQLGVIAALLMIYCLLAIPFKSYSQPLLVMSVIPFGAAGAVLGLIILGYGLSIIAIMGVLALCGVVVNDSLILVDYANHRRRQGATAMKAIMDAGERRFRPILLTTLTTFGGLAPMVFETSRQARFITPMAVSLGFGILFTTFVCLLVLPSLYLMLENLKARLYDSAASEVLPSIKPE